MFRPRHGPFRNQFLVGASSQDIKATLTANAKSFQIKCNDVMKPQVQINLLKR